jgi:hypothetical protein
MANPFHGVLLNNKYYKFEDGSWRITTPLQNSAIETQNSRTFSVQGKSFDVHSLTLVLENEYYTVDPATNNVSTGTTTWLGISRLFDLKRDLGAKGVSMPLTFVTPAGTTVSVIPTGALDQEMFRATPEDGGVEFRVNLTLDATT